VYSSAKLLLLEGRTLPPFLPACLPTTRVPATAKALEIGAAAAAAAANNSGKLWCNVSARWGR